MRKLRALDLFCCAGGAAMGLSKAGFEVVGVDLMPQPRYPFEFHQGDALAFPTDGFDFIWASPPCQRYTVSQNASKNREAHPDLIAPVRAKLQAWGGPWIMENVVGAPLINPTMLCGLALGLKVKRHRLFESNRFLLAPPCGGRPRLGHGVRPPRRWPRGGPARLPSGAGPRGRPRGCFRAISRPHTPRWLRRRTPRRRGCFGRLPQAWSSRKPEVRGHTLADPAPSASPFGRFALPRSLGRASSRHVQTP